MGRPIVHWEISGHDGPKLQSFYAELFDWKIDSNNPMNYGMVRTADANTINGGIYQCKPTEKPALTFYIHVDDLQKYLDRIGQKGGRTVVPPSPIPGIGTFAMFADPEGNVVGLFKPNMD